METMTVRISLKTHGKLKRIAEQTGESLRVVLEKAIREYEDKEMMRAFNESFARLRADPVAWQEEFDERAEWDCTLPDGLEDDPWIETSTEEMSGSPNSIPLADASREAHALA